ncbi:hypothetical protein BGZ61DRAFT_474131 [Ilyonectria robusta]|uniref:uncharacterized protein n=1 Tax=Ilyonectria robusta TaxID=1079257 RepID=UPI001E8DF281|nr:uncharacterized protein BGZ61DRAFT_474131 [Ilyonectria robusta]KAH8733445.1 hypothetical protein BGZ61DRAFT_474131 [Ilyonectria robusta]
MRRQSHHIEPSVFLQVLVHSGQEHAEEHAEVHPILRWHLRLPRCNDGAWRAVLRQRNPGSSLYPRPVDVVGGPVTASWRHGRGFRLLPQWKDTPPASGGWRLAGFMMLRECTQTTTRQCTAYATSSACFISNPSPPGASHDAHSEGSDPQVPKTGAGPGSGLHQPPTDAPCALPARITTKVPFQDGWPWQCRRTKQTTLARLTSPPPTLKLRPMAWPSFPLTTNCLIFPAATPLITPVAELPHTHSLVAATRRQPAPTPVSPARPRAFLRTSARLPTRSTAISRAYPSYDVWATNKNHFPPNALARAWVSPLLEISIPSARLHFTMGAGGPCSCPWSLQQWLGNPSSLTAPTQHQHHHQDLATSGTSKAVCPQQTLAVGACLLAQHCSLNKACPSMSFIWRQSARPHQRTAENIVRSILEIAGSPPRSCPGILSQAISKSCDPLSRLLVPGNNSRSRREVSQVF